MYTQPSFNGTSFLLSIMAALDTKNRIFGNNQSIYLQNGCPNCHPTNTVKALNHHNHHHHSRVAGKGCRVAQPWWPWQTALLHRFLSVF